jgi:O-antigen/teichoic acid export membrane protein
MGVHQVLFTLFQQRLRQAGAVIAETTGALALLVMAWTLGKTDFGVLAFVAATAAASLLTATISLSFAVKLLRFRPKFNISSWKALLVPAAPIAVTNVLSLVYYRFDIIILSFMHPAEAVGLYGVPSKILDASMGFTLLFSGLVMPLMSRYIDTDFQKFRLYFDTGVDTLVMGTSGLLVVILVFAEEILTAIAGQPFSDGAPALRVLGLVIVVASSRYMLYQAATVLNVQRKVVGGYVVAAIVGVLAYLLLIPSFAGAGAAIGLLVGELIVFVWTLRVLFQSGMQLTAKVHVKILVSVCFTVGLFFWLKSTSSIHWMLGAVFAPLVYFVFLSIIGGVPTHVLELIRPARSVNDSKISADDDDLMKP